MKQAHSSSATTKWFFLFIIAYICVWQILPASLLDSVYPDTAENLALSHALAWSYSKHPPLGMALLHAIQWVIPSNAWANAIANALCLNTSLIGIYLIAKEHVSEKTAIAATMLSSLSLFFLVNFAVQYNQNTIMLPFWVAIIAFTIRATHHNRCRDWLFLAVSIAGGMLAKYENIMIIGLAFIYLLCHIKKSHLKYLIMTIITSLLLLSPHIYWVAHHSFETITYLFVQSDRTTVSYWHVVLGALLAQPANTALCLIVASCCLKAGWAKRQAPYPKLSWQSPLCFFAIIPWLAFVILSAFVTTKAEWGFPLLVAVIPALLYYAHVHVERLKPIAIAVISCHCLIATAYGLNLYFSKRTHRSNWPSHTLAQAAQHFWNQHTGSQPLKYIGGDEYPIYYLTAYLPQKPLMLKNNSFHDAVWINRADFYTHGALFVEQGCHDDSRHLINQGFPVTNRTCLTLPQANKYHPKLLSFTLYLLEPALPPAKH